MTETAPTRTQTNPPTGMQALFKKANFGDFTAALEDQDAVSFSFKVSAYDLDQALTKLAAVTGVDGGSAIKHHLVIVHSGGLSLLGFTSKVFSEVIVEGAVDLTGEGYASFNLGVLQGLIKNRGDFVFSYNSAQKDGDSNQYLTFRTSGSYKGVLPTLSIDPNSLQAVNDKIGSFQLRTPLRSEVFTAILSALKLTAIKNVYNTYQTLLTYIVFSAKKAELSVFSYDSWHMGYYRRKVEINSKTDASLRLALPSGLLEVLEKVALSTGSSKRKKTKAASLDDVNIVGFGITGNSLVLCGQGYRVILPYTQATAKDYDNPTLLLQSLNNKVLEFDFDDRFITAINNLYALMLVKGLQYTMTLKKNAVFISVKTNNGNASDRLTVMNLTCREGITQHSFSFDPDLFRDLIRLLGKVNLGQGSTNTLTVYESCYRIVSTTNSTLVDDQDDTAGKSSEFTITLLGSLFTSGDA